MTSADGGPAWWARCVDVLAHRFVVVTAAVVGLMLLALVVGPEAAGALFLAASLIGFLWVVALAGHDRHEHLCARCLAAMPADPGAAVGRGRRLLWLRHRLSESRLWFAGYVALVVAADLPIWFGWWSLAWLWFLPLAASSALSMHHRALRPWCPYCRRWGDGGPPERVPRPDPSGSRTA